MKYIKWVVFPIILFLLIVLFIYILTIILNDANERFDITNKMNDVCHTKWYTTYVYPSSWWLDSNNFRCQLIEYRYSDEYYKI
jgi:hypothetical protein